MDNLVSVKVRLLSSWMVVLIVLIHSYNLVTYESEHFDGPKVVFYIEYSLSQGICRVAVPFYFLISALLNYSKNNHAETVKSFIKKRAKRLLIPLLIWILIAGLPALLYGLYIDSKSLFSNSSASFLERIYSGAYHLWFLWDLWLVSVTTSLLSLLGSRKRRWMILVFVLSILWFLDIGLYFVRTSSLLFYVIGWLLANTSFYTMAVPKLFRLAALTFWFALIYLNSLVFNSPVVLKLSILVGIFGVWTNVIALQADCIVLNKVTLRHSYFIYLSHVPILGLLGIFSRKLLIDMGPWIAIAQYFISTILAIIVANKIAQLTLKKMPKTYKMLTGSFT